MASPTQSITTSTPRFPVRARISLATSCVWWLSTTSAPNTRARSSFASLPDVTHTRTERLADRERRQRNAPTNPANEDLVVSRTFARVTTIRHAVSVARGMRQRWRRNAPRYRQHVRSRDHERLGQRARAVLSQNRVREAQRIVSGATVLASAIAHPGIHGDASPTRTTSPSDRPRPRCLCNPSRESTPWMRTLGTPFTTERSRWSSAAAQTRTARHPSAIQAPGVGAETQLIESAMSVDRQCSHQLPRPLYSAKLARAMALHVAVRRNAASTRKCVRAVRRIPVTGPRNDSDQGVPRSENRSSRRRSLDG